ncbi:ABC transporter permease [Alteromonas sp. KUL49]|uniref:ABC transporter permease n=1 Tax=Alteromonas sp. KUL49 TaxID=2480798 RepID=UPI00102EDD01|nr:ABC transporter permease [Alteromonas sp. KUL49]TAP42376.1 ABC transporter permease [Alteromonas sp. KUL49]GEA09993.1 ABC transporter ATP-binding protein [Alteromonas sp. KUL49]
MFQYYLQLSIKNLKRFPTLYGLVTLTLAIGVGVFTANLAILNTMASDPIPEKSAQLFHISINTWPVETNRDPITDILRYSDGMALKQGEFADSTVLHYRSHAYIRDAESKSLTRFSSAVRASSHQFLNMVNAPFKYGSTYTDDNSRNVVLGATMNNTLFAGENSVGKTLEVNGELYTVVGVLDEWPLRPMFYHVHEGLEFRGTEDLFIPIETALDSNLAATVRTVSTDNFDTMAETRDRGVYYLQGWVELTNDAQKQRFIAAMQGHSQALKDAGQFPNEIITQLHDVNEWLAHNEVVDNRVAAFAIATSLFLVVCIFNASSLLLARYSATNFDTALKRALGVSKQQLLMQGMVEGAVTGVISGLISLLLAYAFLHVSVMLLPNLEYVAVMGADMLLLGFLLALFTTLLSSLYPVVRSRTVAISTELKG